MRATVIHAAGDIRVTDAPGLDPATADDGLLASLLDRTVPIEETPQAYAAMDTRHALKVMIKP